MQTAFETHASCPSTPVWRTRKSNETPAQTFIGAPPEIGEQVSGDTSINFLLLVSLSTLKRLHDPGKHANTDH
ncbi:hypothetical protein [Comamonas sp. CMM02]|uniref:hypothetical protein n=1 Tax=Comamonas sp. CMM02 TaxID=2769307 RepID=UPI0017822B69|nr:hypothetical protein [Comamonas sp. CMM02]MBD9402992.1 hypothetical protein [Comamonas sp. CMM02]